MRELKPCPFCGQKVNAFSMAVNEGHVCKLEVVCPSCNTTFHVEPNCLTYYSFGEKMEEYINGDAIDIWNRRQNLTCRDCKHSVDYYNDGECYCQHNELRYIKDWDFWCKNAERRLE